MSGFIDYAINHARLTIGHVALSFDGRASSRYGHDPEGSRADVRIPIVYVQLTQRGSSAPRIPNACCCGRSRPAKSVSNVKEMRSTAYEGGGTVLLEFEAGFDSKSALATCAPKSIRPSAICQGC